MNQRGTRRAAQRSAAIGLRIINLGAATRKAKTAGRLLWRARRLADAVNDEITTEPCCNCALPSPRLHPNAAEFNKKKAFHSNLLKLQTSNLKYALSISRMNSSIKMPKNQ